MPNKINYYRIGEYKFRHFTRSGESHLIILEGKNASKISSHLVNKKLLADIAMQYCEIIPLYDDQEFPFAFHIRDCTVEISDYFKTRSTYILITNKNHEKRDSALRELKQAFE